jgi:hypothetical protein
MLKGELVKIYFVLSVKIFFLFYWVSSSQYSCTCIECSNDSSLCNRDCLLLHCLVQNRTCVIIHLVKLINTADTEVAKYKCTTFKNNLLRFWVAHHGGCQTNCWRTSQNIYMMMKKKLFKKRLKWITPCHSYRYCAVLSCWRTTTSVILLKKDHLQADSLCRHESVHVQPTKSLFEFRQRAGTKFLF